MEELLQQSKAALLAPTKSAKRFILVTINLGYILILISCLILEKVSVGSFVLQPRLFLVLYIPALITNLISLIYNIGVFRFQNSKRHPSSFWHVIFKKRAVLFDRINTIGTLGSIMFISGSNMVGFGNPFNDSLITDYSLALVLIIVSTIVGGRWLGSLWALAIVGALVYNMNTKGWDYQYHFMTPAEVQVYEQALEQRDPEALARQQMLKENQLAPPQAARYFNTWLLFVGVTLYISLTFYGMTNNILKAVPQVITKINQAIQGTNRIHSELTRKDQMHTVFLNLAHELKTPLTLMLSYLNDFVEKYGSKPELEIVINECKKITRDVKNYLELEQLERGKIHFNHEQPAHVSDFLPGTLEMFKSFAKREDLQLNYHVAPNLIVKSDPAAVQKIVNNLVENAIKYSRQGDKINIELSEQDGIIKLDVIDTGIGIPKEAHEKIFEAFDQLHAQKRNVDGIGLGLAIVRQVVTGLSGKLFLDSEQGIGSHFTVHFPKYIAANAIVPEVPPIKGTYIIPEHRELTDVIHDPTKPYLLIVEDNKSLLAFLREKLMTSYNVYLAENGMEALEKLDKRITVDIIISDIMMPEVDGFELLQAVKNSPTYKHIPFIFLTAKTDQNSRITAQEKRVISYLDKPFTIEKLRASISAIEELVHQQKSSLVHVLYRRGQTNMLTNSAPIDIKSFGFTDRQEELVGYILEGLSSEDICVKANIKEATLKTHITNILKKAEVKNRDALVTLLTASR